MPPAHSHPGSTPLAGPLCVLFLCLSPYIYVFERMAILEPLLIALTALALIVASHLEPLSLKSIRTSPPRETLRALAFTLALGLLIPGIVLTKTTGVCLMPAVFYMVWARSGYGIRRFLRLAIPPAALGIALWLVYFIGFVHPHYIEDYRYLFSANAYTGIELDPLATVVLNAIGDGMWMGHILYPAFFVVLALALFWRPRLFTQPLFPALLLWIGGYFAFLVYHNNLQPRYYLVIAVPITAAVALGLDNFRHGARPRRNRHRCNTRRCRHARHRQFPTRFSSSTSSATPPTSSKPLHRPSNASSIPTPRTRTSSSPSPAPISLS